MACAFYLLEKYSDYVYLSGKIFFQHPSFFLFLFHLFAILLYPVYITCCHALQYFLETEISF